VALDLQVVQRGAADLGSSLDGGLGALTGMSGRQVLEIALMLHLPPHGGVPVVLYGVVCSIVKVKWN